MSDLDLYMTARHRRRHPCRPARDEWFPARTYQRRWLRRGIRLVTA